MTIKEQTVTAESDPHMQLVGRVADRDTWIGDRCSIDAAFGVLGTRSAVLLLREAYYGATRFDEFVRRAGITEAVAATRLRDLVDVGVLERRPYRQPGARTREEYVLTPAGAELMPVLLALMQWGDRHLAGQPGPPLLVSHAGCGAAAGVEVRCQSGHTVPLQELAVSAARERRGGATRGARRQ